MPYTSGAKPYCPYRLRRSVSIPNRLGADETQDDELPRAS
jgi:hypothetical protein